MRIKLFGGPYDGVEVDHTAINQHASILPVSGDLGTRVFVLMPPPESWDKLIRGEPAETSPLYPYERVSTPEGPRFEWPALGGLDQALLEAKLKVHQRAQTALSTLSWDHRRAVINTVADLQKSDPESWPKQGIIRISEDKPVYLLQLRDGLRAFIRILESGEIELFDIIQEDTLRLFLERYGGVGSAR